MFGVVGVPYSLITVPVGSTTTIWVAGKIFVVDVADEVVVVSVSLLFEVTSYTRFS